ncbi:proopiomelanocortin a [Latimeria chalumnae]|uniref:Proopiomelanocortin n=1 Tax=Latimeria chalumnae TaxID=7897 RepID=H3AUG9_LATCH|nr:PREDICTED: pro-opiomelanocortin [Latimeria chalumnae]|eukprot:XP_006002164.1 PREDICTED: pro-opiomelanocortin [Latimeria chalumnae]
MLRPVWGCFFAVLGVLWLYSNGVYSQCWESSRCRDLSTEANVLECISACKADLSAESPVYPGNGHMQPLTEDLRKYIMSHFRWNKFGQRNSTGYKREEEEKSPSNSLFDFFPVLEPLGIPDMDSKANEEPLQRQDDKRSYSMEHFRWGKPVGRKRRPIKVYPNGVEEESSESYIPEFRRGLSFELDYPEFVSQEAEDLAEKKDGNYKMHHFRWSSPPKNKRYGGFMRSWDERSQKPLMTLFKNVMIKDGHEKKGL